MARIIVHPEAGVLTREEVLSQRSKLEVVEPEAGAVLEALQETDNRIAFLCSPMVWEDAYLNALSEGDWVVTIGVGYDAYPIDALEQQGILFSNTPGIAGEAISEHVFGMAFAFSRGLLRYRDLQRANEWQRESYLTDFAGDDCCVVGLGTVGEAVASRARAFEMTVHGVKQTVGEYDGTAHNAYPSEELHAALDGARLVVLCVPLTESTRGMIDSKELTTCADDAVIINVARGPVLRTDALLDALEAGSIHAAGLDVFDTEPLPPDSPLWHRDDVLVTPHRGSVSDKYTERFLDVFFDQYDSWKAGELLDHRVV